MKKLFAFIVVGVVLSSAAQAYTWESGTRSRRTTHTFSIKPAPAEGWFYANDFHIRMRAEVQKREWDGPLYWEDAHVYDFNPVRQYKSAPGGDIVVVEDGDYIEVVYTFDTRQVSPTGARLYFAIAVDGGWKCEEYECWFTMNGERVKTGPSLGFGCRVDEDLKSIVFNDYSGPITINPRKKGQSSSSYTTAQIAEMATLPGEQVIDAGNLLLAGQSISYNGWVLPEADTTFFLRTGCTAQGFEMELTGATEVEVIPEPGGIAALLCGLAGFGGLALRRRK